MDKHYDERVNNEADQHSQLMQQQRDFVAAMQLKSQRYKHKLPRCISQATIKYNTYKLKDSSNEK